MVAIKSRLVKQIMLLIAFAAFMAGLVVNAGLVWQGLTTFASFFKALIIGVAIAFILNRPCMYIDARLGLKRKMPTLNRGLAVLLTYLLLLLIIFTFTMFVVPQIIDSSQQFIQRMSIYAAESQASIDRITEMLRMQSIDLAALSNQMLDSIQGFTKNLSGVFSSIVGITFGVISFLFNIFIAFIFSIYLLAGKETILNNCKRVCRSYLPPDLYHKLVYVYHLTVEVFNNFIYGQLTEAVIIGVSCFLGMALLGFEYPLMISTVVGVTALIPMVGAYIGGTLAVLVLALISPVQALWFIVFLVVLQQLEGHLIYPRVVGGSLGLPGIWVLLATIVGSGLAGPLGILLGVPLTAVLYILLKNDVRKREILEES
ncbi:MAG: AI-2E family transporter [Syntrophomonadaceae bacterium]